MNRKHIGALVVALLVLAAVVTASMRALRLGPFSENARFAPVVIFVVMDTVRADRTSLCGYRHPTTPNLEELVEDGAHYACNSHSPSTWTLPSHASFFTGVGPDQHQAGSGGGPEAMKWDSVTPLGPSLPTLAEQMSARGYQTLLLSGNPVVAERMGLTRGFDHVAIGRRFPMMHDHRLAERLNGLLRVARLDPKRPLFAFINIADPHTPWTEIPEGVGFLPPRSGMASQPERRRYESGEMSDDEAERWLAHLSDLYDYSIWRADRSLGLILDVFRRKGWLDEDYRLVITSDHGEYLGEHRMVEHGREFFYEPVTRVPFIYYSTEGAPELPRDLPALASHALLRDGALPVPLPKSFASAFRVPQAPTDTNLPCSFSRAALWQGGTKLVADKGRVMQFDLVGNPEEDRPSPASDHPLAPELLAHCRALDEAYASRPTVDPELDSELAAQLRALGYLSDGDEPPPPEPSDAP